MSRRTVGHRSANKPTSPSDHQSDFPPATPESQLSPEARTAQWVLNHDPHPHHEEEAKEDARAIMAKNVSLLVIYDFKRKANKVTV